MNTQDVLKAARTPWETLQQTRIRIDTAVAAVRNLEAAMDRVMPLLDDPETLFYTSQTEAYVNPMLEYLSKEQAKVEQAHRTAFLVLDGCMTAAIQHGMLHEVSYISVEVNPGSYGFLNMGPDVRVVLPDDGEGYAQAFRIFCSKQGIPYKEPK